LSIPDLIFLGDSKIVIEWINKRGALHAVALEIWKERILENLPLFRNIFRGGGGSIIWVIF
jgi:hypothetical protein